MTERAVGDEVRDLADLLGQHKGFGFCSVQGEVLLTCYLNRL